MQFLQIAELESIFFPQPCCFLVYRIDCVYCETNLAKDRLTHESDAQAHEERVRVSAPFGVLRVFVSDTPYST